MFTVADLLNLPNVNGIQLVAGAGGVGKAIFRANIMDNPDTYDWLVSGEFLLSTGYIFRDDEALQRTVIRKLSDIGCSGLGIKTNRYLEQIPQCMIEEAERLSFPLLELPYGRSLSTTIGIISSKVYEHQESSLGEILDIQRKLTVASLKPGSLRALTRIAASCLDNPILVLDSGWRLLAWEDCPKNPFPLESSFPMKKNAAILPQSFTEGLPTSLGMFRKPVTRTLLSSGGHPIICRIMPVATDESAIYGYIIVWETVHALDTFDYVVLEHVAVSIAAERIRVREREEAKVRIKQDFFDDLLSGNIESLSAIRSLSAMNGLCTTSSYRCILIRFIGDEQGTRRRPQGDMLYRCALLCDQLARERGLSIVTIPRGTQLILLIDSSRKEAAPESLRRYAEALCAAMAEQLSFLPLTVVSEEAENIICIAEVYENVQRAAEVFAAPPCQPSVIFVEDYTVFFLLDRFVGKDSLARFVQRFLGSLITYDAENGTNLLETLDAYFSCSRNLTEVGKRMYIHRNTCIYRMEKIKALLQDDFSSPQRILNYQVALLARRALGE